MVYEKLFCQIFVKYQLSGIMDNAVASWVHGYELSAPNVYVFETYPNHAFCFKSKFNLWWCDKHIAMASGS